MRVHLEVEEDPDGGQSELFGVIVVDTEPEEALSLLDRLDSEWFAQEAGRTRNRLNFTVDTHDDAPV